MVASTKPTRTSTGFDVVGDTGTHAHKAAITRSSSCFVMRSGNSATSSSTSSIAARTAGAWAWRSTTNATSARVDDDKPTTLLWAIAHAVASGKRDGIGSGVCNSGRAARDAVVVLDNGGLDVGGAGGTVGSRCKRIAHIYQHLGRVDTAIGSRHRSVSVLSVLRSVQ